MGLTTVSVIITSLDGKKKVKGTFLVDTGATYTVIPADMASELGLKPDRTRVSVWLMGQ